MKKSQAAKYARWSAAAALLCAGLTLAVYLRRDWTRLVETRNAPPAAPVNVERQSTHLMFSKGEGTRTIFTVEASKSIDFKGLNTSDLEGVKVTIFGKDGARHDTFETHSCRYSRDTGDIVCAGDVEIVLMSREEWEGAAGRLGTPGTMKVETRGVSFSRASGEARTDQEVRFRFADGKGRAVGALYRSEEGTLELKRDVRLQLEPAPGRTVGAGRSGPVEVRGARMEFRRDEGTMFLAGPAEARTESDRLTAPGMLLELDADLHAKRLSARGSGKEGLPEFTSRRGAGTQRLSAEEIVAEFAPDGWVARAEARGQVRGESERAGETETVHAQNAAMVLMPRLNVPRLLVLKGGVDARTRGAGAGQDRRKLTTEELRIAFSGTPRGSRPESAETVGPGRLEWNEQALPGHAARTLLEANQLGLRFDAGGKPRRLEAQGNVRTEKTVDGSTRQTATTEKGSAELQPNGGWSRIELSDNVQLNEAQRSARADRATFERSDQSATLTGHASVRDAASQTSAQKLTFWQSTGELRGEGNVRSSDLSARSGTVHLAPAQANLRADRLEGNSKTGRALYSGHARLWQGQSVLEADSIELLKNERMLNAAGNVRAVFPQALRNGGRSTSSAGIPSPDQAPVIWHAFSGRLSYWDGENRGRLEQNVVVEAPEQRMSSGALDLYFSRGNGTAQGGQQIRRAVGSGGVVVEQGQRRATAERGEYTSADGKFVMSGGSPTIFDAVEGTTTGRQLTFFLADATIIVDSENGSRTLTKHRVENK